MKLRNLLFIVLAAIVFCNCQSYQPTSLTVASYNLRNANGSDSARGDGWGQRYPVIAQMVQYHDFDIFGTQECFLHQLKDMKEALPGYDYIGVGRDDGKDKGEHSAIFYRTDKFDIVEKEISGCRKLRTCRAKAGMPYCLVFAAGALQMQRYRFRVSVLQSPHGPHRQESPCGERFPRTGKDERAGKRQESAGYPDGRLQRRPDPPVLRRICQQRRPL